jgi:hypothetical protein
MFLLILTTVLALMVMLAYRGQNMVSTGNVSMCRNADALIAEQRETGHIASSETCEVEMNKSDFLFRIKSFRLRHGMTETAFGRWAVNSTSYVYRLKNGGDTKLGTMLLVLRKMRLHDERLNDGRVCTDDSNSEKTETGEGKESDEGKS